MLAHPSRPFYFWLCLKKIPSISTTIVAEGTQCSRTKSTASSKCRHDFGVARFVSTSTTFPDIVSRQICQLLNGPKKILTSYSSLNSFRRNSATVIPISVLAFFLVKTVFLHRRAGRSKFIFPIFDFRESGIRAMIVSLQCPCVNKKGVRFVRLSMAKVVRGDRNPDPTLDPPIRTSCFRVG